jgi:hypothetical protein
MRPKAEQPNHERGVAWWRGQGCESWELPFGIQLMRRRGLPKEVAAKAAIAYSTGSTNHQR